MHSTSSVLDVLAVILPARLYCWIKGHRMTVTITGVDTNYRVSQRYYNCINCPEHFYTDINNNRESA